MAELERRYVTAWVCALCLSAVWIVAALPKVLDPASFLAAVKTYQILPHGAAVAVSLWLPWLEASIAVALLVPPLRQAAFVASAALMTIFLVGLLQAWARGLSITCGCFGTPGVTGPGDYLWAFLRDVVLLSVAAFGIWLVRGVPASVKSV
jgi:hypothetical protein